MSPYKYDVSHADEVSPCKHKRPLGKQHTSSKTTLALCTMTERCPPAATKRSPHAKRKKPTKNVVSPCNHTANCDHNNAPRTAGWTGIGFSTQKKNTHLWKKMWLTVFGSRCSTVSGGGPRSDQQPGTGTLTSVNQSPAEVGVHHTTRRSERVQLALSLDKGPQRLQPNGASLHHAVAWRGMVIFCRLRAPPTVLLHPPPSSMQTPLPIHPCHILRMCCCPPPAPPFVHHFVGTVTPAP